MAVRAMTLGLAALSLAGAPLWRATLEPKDGSTVRGTATVEAVGTDSSRATVQITGAKSGSTVAWHIHNGACAAPGPVFGSASAYPVLKVGSDGSAQATVTLAGAPPASGTYSVSVHKSAADMTPVACGALAADNSMPNDSTMKMAPKDSTMRP